MDIKQIRSDDAPRRFKYSTLVVCVLCVMSSSNSHALESLDDTAMRGVNGQDGLAVNVQYDEVRLDNAYWEDRTGDPTGADIALRGYANNVSITGSNLGTSYQLQATTDGAGNAGIDLRINSRYGTIAAESFNLCDGAGNNCGLSLGGLTIQSTENAELRLITTNGLLNQNSLTDLTLGLRNLNVYISQADGILKNQIILKDFNFNFRGVGNVWVDDTGGLKLLSQGGGRFVDLIPVDDLGAHASVVGAKKPGLNIELLHKGGVAAGVFNTTDADGLIRLGASGRVVNASIDVRGINAVGAANNILGFSVSGGGTAGTAAGATVLGSTGLGLRMRADFVTNAGNVAGGNEFRLELAHAGNNAYGFEFSNLKPLLVRASDGGGALNPQRAYIDTGNVYLNLAETRSLSMPVNTVLNSATFGTSTITTATDYQHLVHNTATNPKSLVAAVRGLEFQAVARRGRFLISNDVPSTDAGRVGLNDATTNDWGIGLPIYNLNTNIAIFGAGTPTAQRTGFSLGLSTQGRNASSSLSTSILLVDGAPNPLDGNNPTSYYFGLRNIDMLITAYGSIGVQNDQINFDIPKLLIAASFEVAAGYLPGARYRSNFTGCTATESACYVPINNFARKDDAAFGVNLRLDGAMTLNLIPGGSTLANNNIRFRGDYLIDNSAIQITDPINNSILGLDNIKGRVGFDNAIKINRDNVAFNVGLTFNPNRNATEVFRVQNVNLYPFSSATNTVLPAQRLGEIAITGGRLDSTLTLRPFATP